jgi:polyisoprenoid-binding protein YceI
MSTEATTTVTELPARGRYRIEPTESTVRFTSRAAFGLMTVHGTIPVRAGSVAIADGSATVAAELDPAGLSTDNEKRDKDLCGAKYLDVARYPELRFEGTVPRGLTAMRGTLTVHGATAETIVDIRTVRRTDDRIEVVAAARVDRHSFGVSTGRGLVSGQIDVELTVTLHTDFQGGQQ